MKPGYQTSEFWITTGVLVIGFLVHLGFINAADVGAITDNWSKCVTSIFTLVTQLGAALAYLYSRHQLKRDEGRGARGETKTQFTLPAKPLKTIPMILAGLAGLLLAGSANAQAPPATNSPPPYLLGWRAWVHQSLNAQQTPHTDPAVTALLQQQTLLHQQQVALQTQILAVMQAGLHAAPAPTPAPTPTPGPLVLLLPPSSSAPGALQSFPIQGQPLQQFPIQGQPLQNFPIQGQPLQQFPLQGQPLQPLPLQGQPLQGFPVAPAPQPQPHQVIPPPNPQPAPSAPIPSAPTPNPQTFPIAPNPQPQPAPSAPTFQRFTFATGVPRL